MSSSYPEVLPIITAEIVPESGKPPAPQPPPLRREPANFWRILWQWARSLLGWSWCWLIGVLFCVNPANNVPFIGWLVGLGTAILVEGWLYRWMQTRVLRNWWRKSRFAREGSFREYLASLGPDAPRVRPRWFLRERIRATLHRPGPGNQPASAFRLMGRLLTIPWFSLWRNFKTGLLALFCTYLITGWGCLLIYFGWIVGWQNSFYKVYEEAGVGAGISLVGYFLLILALFYVPMAQVHQAVTGEVRAFFQFRFVWRLVQARATAYCWLTITIALFSLLLAILKGPVFLNPESYGNDESLSNAAVLRHLQEYLFWCGVVLFAALLLTRRLAARVYSSAVLKVLRQGWIGRAELHPKVAAWLDRLEIYPVPLAATTGLERVALSFLQRCYRVGGVYVVMFVVWFLFIAKTYVGEFLNYHPVTGFTNHELVQLPTIDLVPEHLRQSAQQEQDRR